MPGPPSASRSVSAMLFVLAAASGCGGARTSPASQHRSLLRTMGSNLPGAAPMGVFEDGGYELSGAEYWPYVGAVDARYPEDVMWGFYPEKGVTPPGESEANPGTASRAAVACAERAHAELKSFLASRPKELDDAVEAGKEQGISRRFYLWTNDYSRAADPFPPGVRPARLWYWKRKTPAPPKPPGYWKWESVVTQSGECKTPSVEEARAYLREKRQELAKTAPAAPSP